MADLGAQEQFSRFFGRLNLVQKLMLGGVTIAVIAALAMLVSLVNTPAQGTLFNNLHEQDASKIVAKLKERSVPYSIEDGGKTILVPKNQIYELRLSLAGEGLPQSSVIGYEIFDRTNLGISDFVQKVNYRRALEGEIARTILQLDEVEGARVHIVMPDKALFKEDEKPATASVVLKLKSGKPLKHESIQGIAHLVAASVEGMEAANVNILDSRGTLLSEATKPNSVAALTSTQYELQQKVESYIAQKAQSLLDGVVGRGNALVQVNAELDFRQVERTLEKYDPESVVRGESVSEERTVVSDSTPPSTRTSTTTNYEIGKSVEHIVENMGNIRRLSVAALVNGTTRTVERDGQKVTEVVPRPADEMEKLTGLVKTAVGFNTERNDEVTVTNLSLGPTGNTPEQDFVYKESPLQDYQGIIQKVLLVAVMIAGALILRSLIGRLRVRSAMAGGGEMPIYERDLTPAGEPLKPRRPSIHLPSPEDEIPEETLIRMEKKKRVMEYIADKPDEGSRLLKVWLTED